MALGSFSSHAAISSMLAMFAGALPMLAQPGGGAMEHSAIIAPAVDSTMAVLGPRLGLSSFTYDPTVSDTMVMRSPTVCVMAALREERRTMYSAAEQRARFIPRPDTIGLSAAAARVARQCGAQWTAQNTPFMELSGLFRLSFMGGQLDRMRAAGAQWLRDAGPHDTARGEALVRQLQLLGETPPRALRPTAEMHRTSAALDALGMNAAEERVDALMYLRGLAGLSGDYARQLTMIDSIRSLIRHIPSPDTRWFYKETMLDAIVGRATVLFNFPFDVNAPAFQAVVERGLVEAKEDIAAIDSHHKIPIKIPTTFNDYVYTPMHMQNDSLVTGLGVGPAAPFVAQHWYGRPDSIASYPRRGVLTVVIPISDCRSGSCERTYAEWRRLHAEFAPRGVDFVMLTATKGSFGLSTTLSTHDEVDSLRMEVRTHLQLPGILGIQETRFKALPDGRKMPVDPYPMGMGVVTRDGLFWARDINGETASYTQLVTFLKNQLSSH